MNQAKENMPPIIVGALKGLASVIPSASIALNIYSELQAKQIERKIRRLEEFINAFSKDLDGLKAKHEQLNEDCIKREDFPDIFEHTIRYILNERNQEKRIMFKNIFENTIKDDKFDFDITERYMRILEQLDRLQITILKILYNPSKFNEEKGFIISTPINNEYQQSWGEHTGGEVLTKLLGLKDFEVRSAVSLLIYYGFVDESMMEKSITTNSNPVHVLNNTLTVFGRQFVNYCKG